MAFLKLRNFMHKTTKQNAITEFLQLYHVALLETGTAAVSGFYSPDELLLTEKHLLRPAIFFY
jgi:hypothetical protein